MVALTTLTLWSLGQVVFRPEPSDATGVVPTASGAPAPAATDRPSL
jgi:hypothetical protein